ncbi:hypothetical protein J6590_016899 [Homalodisca vitripennis]|nr:hypothetical protein J6590_016899 [Homalodisca vitripennis]
MKYLFGDIGPLTAENPLEKEGNFRALLGSLAWELMVTDVDKVVLILMLLRNYLDLRGM